MINKFSFAPTPHLYFGTGVINKLPELVDTFGSNVLLVTGTRSFLSSSRGQWLLEVFKKKNNLATYTVDGEPTPGIVDAAARKHRAFRPDVVVAVGGGSVLDAGKAISAMMPLQEPVKEYLEGVGSKSHPGMKVPFVAVPTTAGTGSEATKNAVISETGINGFKRSLRHHNFVPDIALIDPELTVSCPQTTTAASGMDAFTQLLESYLSTTANPMTDALAMTGLAYIRDSLLTSFRDGTDLNARSGMALAAYLSGVTLANAGLGLVHGFASSVGARYPIPHGAICSVLMSPVNILTVNKLRKENSNPGALKKYGDVGKLFRGSTTESNDYYIDFLMETIVAYANEMNIPRLKSGGVSSSDAREIAIRTENKNHPVQMNPDEIEEMVVLAC